MLRIQLIVRRTMAAPDSLTLAIYDLLGILVIAVAIYGRYVWVKWLVIAMNLIVLGFVVLGFTHLPAGFRWEHVVGLVQVLLCMWMISFLYRDIQRLRKAKAESDAR